MAEQEYALLHNYLVVGALLFGIGLIGFLSRRNMIVMFLSAEMMLQGVSLSLVAWGRFYNDFGGPDAGDLHHRRGRLRGGHRPGPDPDAVPAAAAAWTSPSGRSCARSNQPPYVDQELPELPAGGAARLAQARPRRPRAGNPTGRDRYRRQCLRSTTLLILIPAMPLVAAVVTAVLGPRVLRGRSHVPTVLALGISFVASLLLLFQVDRGAGRKRPSRATRSATRRSSPCGPGRSSTTRTRPRRRAVRHRRASAPPARRRTTSTSASRCGPTR